MRLVLVAVILGLTVFALSACASSKSASTIPLTTHSSSTIPLTTHSCRTPTRYYSIAEIEQAFAAHGIKLHRAKKPPGHGGAVPDAYRTGKVVAFGSQEPGDVMAEAVYRRAPLWLDKLALNCSDTPFLGTRKTAPKTVLGNISVPLFRPDAAAAVKAALAQLQRTP